MTYTRFILHCVSEGSKIKNVAMNVSTSNQKEFLWPFRSLCQLRTIFLFLISLFLVSWRDERFLKSRSDFRRTWKMWNEKKKMHDFMMSSVVRHLATPWMDDDAIHCLLLATIHHERHFFSSYFIPCDVRWCLLASADKKAICHCRDGHTECGGCRCTSAKFRVLSRRKRKHYTHTHRTQRADRHFCILFCFGTFKLIAQHLHFCHFVIYSRRYMGRRQWILILNSVYAFSILSLHFILYGLFAMNVEYAYHKQ